MDEQANFKVILDQPGDVPYTCADVTKAYTLPGYRARVSFEDGICQTAASYKGAYEGKSVDIRPEV